MGGKGKYERQIRYQAKLKHFGIRLKVKDYESFKKACKDNDTLPSTEIRKHILEYTKENLKEEE